MINVNINNGKYTVHLHEDGNLTASRYGIPWQDLCGNNLVYWLAVELSEAREKIQELQDTSNDSEYYE